MFVNLIFFAYALCFRTFQQSKYNIQEYKLQKAYALAPYTVKKFPPRKNTTKDAT